MHTSIVNEICKHTQVVPLDEMQFYLRQRTNPTKPVGFEGCSARRSSMCKMSPLHSPHSACLLDNKNAKKRLTEKYKIAAKQSNAQGKNKKPIIPSINQSIHGTYLSLCSRLLPSSHFEAKRTVPGRDKANIGPPFHDTDPKLSLEHPCRRPREQIGPRKRRRKSANED